MVEGSGTPSYTYDNAGRLTQLTNWNSETTSWTYDNANRTTRQTFASGAYTDYGYDTLQIVILSGAKNLTELIACFF